MKVNCYKCDLCGNQIENGREYKITVKYAVSKDIKVINRVSRQERETRSMDLCADCFKEWLPAFVREGKDD